MSHIPTSGFAVLPRHYGLNALGALKVRNGAAGNQHRTPMRWPGSTGNSGPASQTRTRESRRDHRKAGAELSSAAFLPCGGWRGRGLRRNLLVSAGGVQCGDRFLKGFQLVDDLVLRRLQVTDCKGSRHGCEDADYRSCGNSYEQPYGSRREVRTSAAPVI